MKENLTTMVPDFKLQLTNIARQFDSMLLFKKISFQLVSREVIGITGRNGSGKSTLLRIIAGLMRPSAGTVAMFQDKKLIAAENARQFIGLVAPALSLYDELTASENLSFFARVRGIAHDLKTIDSLLVKVGLAGWEHELYAIFSSGMKQRLKIAQAILHRPPLLLLDEPFNNLDAKGIEIVEQIINEQRSWGLTIIASNEPREIEYADRIINLSQ